MIELVTLKRFKCFEDESFLLRRLTLLTGANASGKSTLIQAMCLLRQSIESGSLERGRLDLNGELASVGTVKDVLTEWAHEDSIEFGLKTDRDPLIEFKFHYEHGKPESGSLEGETLGTSENSLMGTQFAYLAAERLGSRSLYSIPQSQRSRFDVGIGGEHAPYVLAEMRDEQIRNRRMAIRESESLSLSFQLEQWMRKLIPGFSFVAQRIPRTDNVTLNIRTSTDTDYLRPTNTGFGISYALPIVLACLMLRHDDILIVENPESHLHPASQSEMGRLLGLAALHGPQIVVESHSDHILNGVRTLVAKELVDPQTISIQYFKMKSKEPGVEVESMEIDKSGRLNAWPKGFFDQIDSDLQELL